MPSTSQKQHRFFEAVAHSPKFAKEAGVPQSVGNDFAAADDKAELIKTGVVKKKRYSPKKAAPRFLWKQSA